MAESLDDGEFWLPSQFLTDDDVLLDKSEKLKDGAVKRSANWFDEKRDGYDLDGEVFKPLFPFEFSSGFGPYGLSSSDLSSPVESVVGSTETESDEEDFLAGLTRQMAHSTLDEGFKRNDNGFSSEKTKVLYSRFVSLFYFVILFINFFNLNLLLTMVDLFSIRACSSLVRLSRLSALLEAVAAASRGRAEAVLTVNHRFLLHLGLGICCMRLQGR